MNPSLIPVPRTHTCRHPALHRLRTIGVCLGWLIANAYLAVPALLWLSGGRATTFFLSLLGWVVLGIPFGVGLLWALSRGACGRPTLAQASRPAYQHIRTIERVVLSPAAARQQLGVEGTVTLERITHAQS